MQVTTDSSSPSRSTVFGQWYTGFDFKAGAFRAVHIPRKADIDISKNSLYRFLPSSVPDIDKSIFDSFTLEEMIEFPTTFYAAMVLHNFAIFQEAKEAADQLTYGDRYIMNQLISSDMSNILTIIDEIVKSDNPIQTYHKYLPFISTYEQKANNGNINKASEDFFTF
jgi:hypothetical protein